MDIHFITIKFFGVLEVGFEPTLTNKHFSLSILEPVFLSNGQSVAVVANSPLSRNEPFRVTPAFIQLSPNIFLFLTFLQLGFAFLFLSNLFAVSV
jgi:hypothetical protein